MAQVRFTPPAGRERWEFEHDGRRFLALRHDGRWVVTDALCPHRHGPLVEGLVRGDCLVCPSHWYTFDLADGRCRTTPDLRLGVYQVSEEDGVMLAEIPERVRRSWAEVLRDHARGVPPGRTTTPAEPGRRA